MKPLVYFLALIMVAAAVSAACSTNREDYYYITVANPQTGLNYYAYELVDNLAMNGSMPVVGENPQNYGWWVADSGSYESGDAHTGNYYLHYGGNTQIYFNDPSFNGTVSVWLNMSPEGINQKMYIGDSLDTSYVQIGYENSAPVNYSCNGDTPGECLAVAKSITPGWQHYVFVFNGSTVYGYVEDTLMYIGEGYVGLGQIQFEQSGALDDLMVYNSSTCPQEVVAPAPAPAAPVERGHGGVSAAAAAASAAAAAGGRAASTSGDIHPVVLIAIAVYGYSLLRGKKK